MPLGGICPLDSSWQEYCSIIHSWSWYSACLGYLGLTVPCTGYWEQHLVFSSTWRTGTGSGPLWYLSASQHSKHVWNMRMLSCYLNASEPALWGPQERQVILPPSGRTSFQHPICWKADAHWALSCLKCFWRDESFGGKNLSTNQWFKAEDWYHRSYLLSRKTRWTERKIKKHHLVPCHIVHTLKWNSCCGWGRPTTEEVLFEALGRGPRGQRSELRTGDLPWSLKPQLYWVGTSQEQHTKGWSWFSLFYPQPFC